MFIEITAWLKQPCTNTDHGRSWTRCLVNAEAIELVTEFGASPEQKDYPVGEPDFDKVKSTVQLISGNNYWVTESLEEVVNRVARLGEKGSPSYSVTLDKSGFSSTTVVPST